MLKWVHHSPPPKNHAVVNSSEALDSKDKENEKQCENKRREKEKSKEQKEILEALRRRIGVRRNKNDTPLRLNTDLLQCKFLINYLIFNYTHILIKHKSNLH